MKRPVSQLILETSLHSFFELGMFGLPLLQWIFARRKDTVPRKRSNVRPSPSPSLSLSRALTASGCLFALQGTNPRYFSAYYLIPIHTFCLFITCLFAVLNPLVIPFGTLYFFVAYGILRNQFIHVYQHQYDTKGKRPTIRFVRYTLDGHIVTQVRYLPALSASIGLVTFVEAGADFVLLI